MKRTKEYGLATIVMVLLVVLRLAIGWHFFFEGAHKLDSFARGETTTSKPFTSAGYFREAPGPLALEMRQVVGDPDDEALARLEVQPPPSGEDPLTAKPYLRTPLGLKKDWEFYLNEFSNKLDLDASQRGQAQAKLEQAEDAVVHWLTLKADDTKPRDAQPDNIKIALKEVEKPSPSGNATLKVQETPAERVAEYRQKVQEYRDMLYVTDQTFGTDVAGPKRLAAKAEAAAMRASLTADLDKKAREFKESLASLLTPEQQKKDVLFWGPRSAVWWIDGITAWGLAIIGGCLLLGLLTRTNCVLGAVFLLMLYFSSPPWPWLPTPPNSMGNTPYVNGNVIEMFALLLLATTASGRWFGLDALVHWTWNALLRRKAP
jgi:uncharacterized membrane protein YphA (DoxX/SURF4 family)